MAGPAVDRALEAIDRAAKSQARLIEDLLDMSRIISGKLRLETAPIDLAPVVAAAIDSMRPAAHAKSITLGGRLDSAAGTVVGDAGRLQQVVWNLLSNAIKFTPERGHVEVTLQRAGDSVELTVRDSGTGISPRFMGRVFEPFSQADSSTTRMHGGLGLGLAIVRHVVELHGGWARVESAGEGAGSVFTVGIPLAPSPERDMGDARAAGLAPAAAEPRRLAGLRVLLVDDQRDTCDALQAILEGAGADVRARLSALEALAELSTWRADVLVSDLGMPGEDGYALIRSVRANAESSTIPAVALTGYARVEDRDRALEAGFHRHVVKPVDPSELVRIVAELAGRR